jgi:putative SOS response-associated peptidase YedK
VLADGFYEWVKQPGQKSKIPHYIQLESKEPFGFAGLWEIWHAPDGSEIKSCTIITTSPNEMVEKLHNRMPVILPQEAYEPWLDPGEKTAKELDQYIKPYPAVEMLHYPVSTFVNSPKNNSPDCIVPAS